MHINKTFVLSQENIPHRNAILTETRLVFQKKEAASLIFSFIIFEETLYKETIYLLFSRFSF